MLTSSKGHSTEKWHCGQGVKPKVLGLNPTCCFTGKVFSLLLLPYIICCEVKCKHLLYVFACSWKEDTIYPVRSELSLAAEKQNTSRCMDCIKIQQSDGCIYPLDILSCPQLSNHNITRHPPPSQLGQPLASAASSPQHLPGPETFKEPTHSPQQPTSDNAPPQKQGTDEKMQVSPLSLPMVDHLLQTLRLLLNLWYLLPSNSSNTDPTLAVASSDKLPSIEYKDSDVASGDGEHKEKGNDGDMESVVASGSV